MKQKFQQIEQWSLGPGKLIHCTHCGDEYNSSECVFGIREEDARDGFDNPDGTTKLTWFCRNDNCYGSAENRALVFVTVE